MGPGERELNRVIARYAVQVRSAVIIPCGALGIVASEDWRTVPLVVLAFAWCALRLYWLRRSPGPGWVAGAQALVVLVIGSSQLWTGPQPVDSWVFVLASITNGTTQFEWCMRPWWAAGLSGLTSGAYLTGHAIAAAFDPVPVLRLVVEAVLARAAYLMIRRRARAADRMVERAARLRRDASVAAARRAGEREYLATLHDTASATLLMVSAGEQRPAWLPERAARDLEVLAAMPDSGGSRVDLAALLAPVIEHPEVAIEAEIHGPLVLPAGPALGILHGVREAVTNVRRHAGVTAANLFAVRDGDDRVVVELRDAGRGFQPGSVGAHRRGISGSIVERMAAAGGEAVVESTPGEGTVVRWVWPHDS
jgi:signal transduction histidine kinase